MGSIKGKEYCKLDAMGRVKLPAAIKKQIQSEDNRFVVRNSMLGPFLELWTYDSFDDEVERLQQILNPYNRMQRKALRKLTEGNIIELDTADRLLLPAEQREVLGDDRDLVILGIGRYMEVWSKQEYKKQDAPDEALVDFVENVSMNLYPSQKGAQGE